MNKCCKEGVALWGFCWTFLLKLSTEKLNPRVPQPIRKSSGSFWRPRIENLKRSCCIQTEGQALELLKRVVEKLICCCLETLGWHLLSWFLLGFIVLVYYATSGHISPSGYRPVHAVKPSDSQQQFYQVKNERSIFGVYAPFFPLRVNESCQSSRISSPRPSSSSVFIIVCVLHFCPARIN